MDICCCASLGCYIHIMIFWKVVGFLFVVVMISCDVVRDGVVVMIFFDDVWDCVVVVIFFHAVRHCVVALISCDTVGDCIVVMISFDVDGDCVLVFMISFDVVVDCVVTDPVSKAFLSRPLRYDVAFRGFLPVLTYLEVNCFYGSFFLSAYWT